MNDNSKKANEYNKTFQKRYYFYLNKKYDSDLIELLEKAENKSAVIKLGLKFLLEIDKNKFNSVYGKMNRGTIHEVD